MKSTALRRYLLTGLIVWLPILATIGILHFIIDLLDQTISLLPKAYRPEQLLGYNLPGLGVLLSLLLLFFTGVVATNYFGRRLFVASELLLEKIPLVRSVYNASKQIIHAILGTNSQSFRQVLLVEYPRQGMWSIAFQTGVGSLVAPDRLGEEMVSIFIPTTPNPTSGFLMLVPKSDIIELSMTIDDALKFIISLGMMQPVDPSAFSVRKKTN